MLNCAKEIIILYEFFDRNLQKDNLMAKFEKTGRIRDSTFKLCAPSLASTIAHVNNIVLEGRE